jgi:hypothetical protein
LVLAPFWLLPVEQNSLYVHAEMTVPIYLWTLLMSLALNKVWRRYRLAVHGLDPGLADATRDARCPSPGRRTVTCGNAFPLFTGGQVVAGSNPVA